MIIEICMKEELEIGISDSRRLIEVVNKIYSYDMSNLAFTSLKRRIANSMMINELTSIDEFINRIEKNPLFYKKFLADIAVEVTEMFRDPSFWRYLKDSILPVLLSNFKNLQIWIPNCSSGEELYSLLILLKEMSVLDKTEIFATELNDELLEKAKKGSISTSKLEISEANYKRINETGEFSKYYSLETKSFKIDPTLFERVTFVSHDLSKLVQLKRGLHLILFRNNFIYFKSNLQENVLNLFHKSLSLNGYLILGNKEAISWCRDAKKFTEVNPGESVYKKTLV